MKFVQSILAVSNFGYPWINKRPVYPTHNREDQYSQKFQKQIAIAKTQKEMKVTML